MNTPLIVENNLGGKHLKVKRVGVTLQDRKRENKRFVSFETEKSAKDGKIVFVASVDEVEQGIKIDKSSRIVGDVNRVQNEFKGKLLLPNMERKLTSFRVDHSIRS